MEDIRNTIILMLIGICLIMMLFSFITNSVSQRRKYAFFFMSFFAMILLISDKLVRVFNGDPNHFWIPRISKFNVYLLFLLILLAFNNYLVDLFSENEKLKTIFKWLNIVKIIIYTGIITLIISQFVGIYYTFDENNLYHRSNGFFIAYIYPILSILLQLSAIIQSRKYLRKRLFIALLLFTTMPLIAAFGQFFLHDVSFTSVTIVSMVVLLYSFSILDTNNLLKIAHEKELEFFKEKQENSYRMLVQTSEALASTIDAKDKYTNGHSRKVAEYSLMIAERAGKTMEQCQKIYLIGLLHDVGKIGIPDEIINKTTKLTDEEFNTIKTHPVVGDEILSKISSFPELRIGAKYHHERYDGKGYPEGLEGKQIPEIARIIAVADAYDAMASKRSYRDTLPQKIVRQEIVKGIGTQFDPRFAQIMLDLIDEDKEYKMKQM